MVPLERPRPPQAPFNTGNTEDDLMLESLSGQAHLVVPRRWTQQLFFHVAEAADAAAAELRDAWDFVDVSPSPDGTGWVVAATRESQALSALIVAEVRAELSALAARHGGEYDGWQARQ